MTDAPIACALISVSDKAGLVDFASGLARHKVRILSTGGTATVLKQAGIAVTEVSDYTGFPEIMDGRVKTLHPAIHGGVLARRDNSKHRMAMESHNIAPIDLVVVNLYPFAKIVAEGADFEECIENIDIGGPALIRAAAKNHHFVTVVTDPGEYADVLGTMDENDGATDPALREFLAGEAYARTAAYDGVIGNWLAGRGQQTWAKRTVFPARRKAVLRYGENPHQEAALYVRAGAPAGGVVNAQQIGGKPLGYNNLGDADAALELVAEFAAPAAVIVKHANPCGVAEGKTPLAAWKAALACDPESAFGGIVAFNRPLDADLAGELVQGFLELVLAPAIDAAAREILATKPNLRLLIVDAMPDPARTGRDIRTIAGGFLVQDRDNRMVSAQELKTVTKRPPGKGELADLLFAWKVAKHGKSNCVVHAKNGATRGIGAGRTSRIDAARAAAAQPGAGGSKGGTVVASDAFYPFADALQLAIDAGATAAIQPGGSLRDAEVIEAADKAGIAMVFTGMRHFRH